MEQALSFITGNNGILPSLESWIGRPDLGGADRWQGLLTKGSRTGRELEGSWARLVSRGQSLSDFLEIPLEGPLLSPVEGAGDSSTDGSTKSSCIKFLESIYLQALQKVLEDFPQRNCCPVRFFNQRDKISQAWLTALPGPLTHIPSEEFVQAMAWFFMLLTRLRTPCWITGVWEAT